MIGQTSHLDLTHKITRLVEERGWSGKEFARRAGLNRQTVQQIFQSGQRLRNATLRACAKALGLTVSELLDVPLERLLVRDGNLQRLYEQAMQPELLAWMQRHPQRAAQLTATETDELLSLQGTGGPLTRQGVEHFVEQVERKRRLLEQMQVIAGTEYLELLEQFVGLLYEKVQPYRERL